MLFSRPAEFPEFLNEEDVFQLDEVSKDEDELIERGERLVDKSHIDIYEFKIRQKEEWYGLYVQ